MSVASPYLWIVVACAAAVFQTVRFMLQKILATATLSATGATFARFLYSAPLVSVLVLLYLRATAQPLPVLGSDFWAYALSGGLAQIIATVCVVSLFKLRNFAVGVTLMKTEVILSVVVGLLLLGEGVSWAAFGAIGLGLLGVLLLSTPPGVSGWGGRAIWNRGIGLGLASGVLFAVSAVCYRGGSLEVGSTDPVLRAGVTLAAVSGAQMLGMAAWLMWRAPVQIGAVWRARRVAGWLGLLSMAGSFSWFLAFTLQTAAYVKAVGQVELVMGLVASAVFFKERTSGRELTGMAVLCLSILLLVLLPAAGAAIAGAINDTCGHCGPITCLGARPAREGPGGMPGTSESSVGPARYPVSHSPCAPHSRAAPFLLYKVPKGVLAGSTSALSVGPVDLLAWCTAAEAR